MLSFDCLVGRQSKAVVSVQQGLLACNVIILEHNFKQAQHFRERSWGGKE